MKHGPYSRELRSALRGLRYAREQSHRATTASKVMLKEGRGSEDGPYSLESVTPEQTPHIRAMPPPSRGQQYAPPLPSETGTTT